MNVMIVVPHPDDEILGFGGVIQKHVKAGHNVQVCFLTEIRTERLLNQLHQFDDVIEALAPGCERIVIETKLNEKSLNDNIVLLQTQIKEFKPDILYSVFGGDNHQEHEYLFKVVRVATRIWSDFLVKKIYLGEILSSTDQAPKLSQFTFIPTYYVPLTKSEVDKKVECMKMYDGEIQEWPHPRSEKGIINLAEKRGSECRQNYAEAFVTLRNIEDFISR